MTAKIIDYTGVTLSSLCILHCVFLPIIASTLPIAGSIAENEMLHRALVLIAIVPATLAFSRISPSKFAIFIRAFGLFGLLTLLAGAFVEAFHDIETRLRIIGALSLASAHLCRTALHRTHPHQN